MDQETVNITLHDTVISFICYVNLLINRPNIKKNVKRQKLLYLEKYQTLSHMAHQSETWNPIFIYRCQLLWYLKQEIYLQWHNQEKGALVQSPHLLFLTNQKNIMIHWKFIQKNSPEPRFEKCWIRSRFSLPVSVIKWEVFHC